MENELIVIRDTREKNPWDFSFYNIPTKIKTLTTGDYTLEGFEDKLCIERKHSTGELSFNFGVKSKQFWAELSRMLKYEYRYLVLEFSRETLKAFPRGSGIPKTTYKKLRMNANYMISCLDRITNDYGIDVIFADDRNKAVDEAVNIFNMVKNGGNRRPIF